LEANRPLGDANGRLLPIAADPLRSFLVQTCGGSPDCDLPSGSNHGARFRASWPMGRHAASAKLWTG